jgi:ribonuclease J
MEEKKPQGSNPSGNNQNNQSNQNNPKNQSSQQGSGSGGRSRRPRRPRSSGGQQQGEKRQDQQKSSQQGGQSKQRGGQKSSQRGRGGQRGRGRGNSRNPESHYKTPSNVQRSKDGVYTDINQAIAANKEVHEERLKTVNKIDVNNKARVRFTPLGGLGEIGGNMAVLETENSAIIIDVGMSFPTEEMHGVDILVPDFSYLHTIKDKIDGIVITHAHEDHIGAVPYLFKELK